MGSFGRVGAVTTQAVTGETFLMSGTELTDPRIRAAVIMSPSTPKLETAERAFGDVKIPWLLMTGTKDVALIGEMDAKGRLTVYLVLHGAPKYQVGSTPLIIRCSSIARSRRPQAAQHESSSRNLRTLDRILGRIFAGQQGCTGLVNWHWPAVGYGTSG